MCVCVSVSGACVNAQYGALAKERRRAKKSKREKEIERESNWKRMRTHARN